MICAKCHKNEATVHFTAVIDGKAQKNVHLCNVCAAACGLKSANADDPEEWEVAWEKQLYQKVAQILTERDDRDKNS